MLNDWFCIHQSPNLEYAELLFLGDQWLREEWLQDCFQQFVLFSLL